MAEEKVKLNKTELKTQKDLLRQREEFLPVLELKKQQLQQVVDAIGPQIEALRGSIGQTLEGMREWVDLLSEKVEVSLESLYRIREVRTASENIAGVDVPTFEEVLFEDSAHDLFSTPPWVDYAERELRKLAAVVEQIRVLERRRELLAEELRETTIRVNLFEKILIPQHRDNIKRIKIYLGDQEVAAISIAKIAKRKLEAQKEGSA